MARRAEVASVAGVLVMHRCTPPPRQKVCKVFETKDIRLDFDLTSYAKSKSPALAGLGFFSDLSVSAVSRVSMAIVSLTNPNTFSFAFGMYKGCQNEVRNEGSIGF